MSVSEQAAFDALVAELDAALRCLHEPPVREHAAFAIEPWPHFVHILCVSGAREGAANFLFVAEADWLRVDIAGLEECLDLPLPGNRSRGASTMAPIGETLTRLLTSNVTVHYGRWLTKLVLTDLNGESWCRNTYRPARMPPHGIARGESQEFSALCPGSG